MFDGARHRCGDGVGQDLCCVDVCGRALAVHLRHAIGVNGTDNIIGGASQTRICVRIRRVTDMRGGDGLGRPFVISRVVRGIGPLIL